MKEDTSPNKLIAATKSQDSDEYCGELTSSPNYALASSIRRKDPDRWFTFLDNAVKVEDPLVPTLDKIMKRIKKF